MLMFVCGLAVLLAGSYCCIHLPDAEALEQAALLPFADDPQAARSMSRATGRVCQEVVSPAVEPIPRAETWAFEA
ncbi:hypothetical protein [Stutzerimonas azotifigens]|uniref:hypothetical protein n=1 Tax=Stutzerimonas azotifigens TaxID=291995 RepID=UPI00040DCFFD|nr:hypothetical protein [Stutzerimonas azotifigens]